MRSSSASQGSRASSVLDRLAGVVVLAAWLIAVAWIGPPGGDFANYFTAAALWAEGVDLRQLYDYRWFTEQASRLGFGDRPVGFAVLTPPSVLFSVPLLPLGPEGAGRAWQLVQAVLGVGVVAVLAAALRAPAWAIGVCAMAAWPSLGAHLTQGQFHLPAVFALSLGLLAWKRERRVFAGICWGLAAGLKVHAWPLVVALGFAREPRALLAGLGTLLVGGVVSVMAVGWPVHAVWLREIAPASASGFFVHPWHLSYQSLGHGLRILFHPMPGLNDAWMSRPDLAAQISAMFSVAVIGFTVVTGLDWRQLTGTRRMRLLGAASLCALVSGPILASYHLTLLIPPVIWSCVASIRGGAGWRGAVMAALAVFAMWTPLPATPLSEVTPLSVFFALPRLWALVGLWAVMVPWAGSRSVWLARGLSVCGAVLIGAQTHAPEVIAERYPLIDPGMPLISADLIGTADGSLWFSGLSGTRQGRPGRGWMGFRLPPGDREAVEIVASDPGAHVWSPSPVGPAEVRWGAAVATPRVGPNGGRLDVRQIGGQAEIFWTPPDGEARRLTHHPGWDGDPVWDPRRGRIWFLSDRGVGVRALRLWWMPAPNY